jgi:hypothetical protein
VLRVAAEEASAECRDVVYFPSYEIVTGPQAPEDFFEPDRRNVSSKGVSEVMGAFLRHCEIDGQAPLPPIEPADLSGELSAGIVEGECEEVMLGR